MERESLDAIMEAMEGTSIRECEITAKNSYVKIVRDESSRPVAAHTAAVVDQVESGATDIAEAPIGDIKSSWVGYFYRGAKSDGKPLLKLRDLVKPGQQVGIVITMNIVHQVISEVEGKLTEFLVEDGQPVEYDQPLLRISKEQ